MKHPIPMLSTLAVCAVAFGAATAKADVVYTAENGSTATIYGQLNPAYLSFSDGEDTKSLIVDNNNSTSRVGLWLEWPFADKSSLKFNFETSLGLLQSNAVNMGETPQFFSWSETNIRKLELIYGASFGKFYAGQGSMATDSIAEIDYSKTAVVGYSDYQAVAGGFAFRQADGTLSSITIKNVFTNLEGTRRFRLRYDTPDFNGFTGSFAYGEEVLTSGNNNLYYDAALRYNNTFGDVKVGAGLGYSVVEAHDGSTTESLMGSASALHVPTGLNMTLASGENIDGGSYIYVKGGWIGNLMAAGETAVALEYYNSNDIGVVNGSGKSWGVMTTQRIDAYNTELYLGYREYELTQADVDYQDASSVLFGARWKF